MSYNLQNDTGKYQQAVQSYYANPSDLYDGGSVVYTVTPAAAELPHYAKSLSVFVPAATATATVTIVSLNAADTQTAVLTFGPGNWTVPAFVRRVTAVTGTGVIVTAFAD